MALIDVNLPSNRLLGIASNVKFTLLPILIDKMSISSTKPSISVVAGSDISRTGACGPTESPTTTCTLDIIPENGALKIACSSFLFASRRVSAETLTSDSRRAISRWSGSAKDSESLSSASPNAALASSNCLVRRSTTMGSAPVNMSSKSCSKRST